MTEGEERVPILTVEVTYYFTETGGTQYEVEVKTASQIFQTKSAVKELNKAIRTACSDVHKVVHNIVEDRLVEMQLEELVRDD